MVIDINNRSHVASGRPDGGQYETENQNTRGDTDITAPTDLETRQEAFRQRRARRSHTRQLFTNPADFYQILQEKNPALIDPRYGHKKNVRVLRELIEKNPHVLWENILLAAHQPVVDEHNTIIADYRNEPVCTPEEEVKIRNHAIMWEENGRKHYGPIMRGLRSWFPSESQCRETAEALVDERLIALRRSCLSDQSKSYSPRLVQYAVNQPVRVERIFAKDPYRISAHRMRVGRRYRDQCRKWSEQHQGRLPNRQTRDRLWDETMSDYIQEKIAKGVSYGHGLYYSNGKNARPEQADQPLRHDKNGNVFNGREDFERMLTNGMSALTGNNSLSFEDLIQPNDNGIRSIDSSKYMSANMPTVVELASIDQTSNRTADEELHAAWLLGRSRGYDMTQFAKRYGLRKETTHRWEQEYMHDPDAYDN